MRNLSDKEYFEVCNESYKKDILIEGKEIEIKEKSKQSEIWKVLESVDNKKSGLQGSALVPANEYDDIKSGKIEPSNMIFVSRGTENLTDWGCNITDLGTYPRPRDIKRLENSNIVKITKASVAMNPGLNSISKKYIIGSLSSKNNQFIEYEEFVDDTVKKYNPKEYSFTGHSLGGALAQYVAVLKDKKAVTYAAAKPYRLLPKEFQKKVDSGYYNNKIFNYKHVGDPVGIVPFGELIGTQLFVQSNVRDFSERKFGINLLGGMINVFKYIIGQHGLESFSTSFTSNGAIKLLIKSDEIRGIINNLSENIEMYNELIKKIDNRMDIIDDETLRIYKEMEREIGTGEFYYLTNYDLDEIFNDIVPYSQNRFYDREMGEELIYYVHNEKSKLENLLFEIEKGVKDIETGDLNSANLFQ